VEGEWKIEMRETKKNSKETSKRKKDLQEEEH
jgi:hypothetical protein